MLGIALGAVAGLTYALYSWAAKQIIDRGIEFEKASMGLIFGLGSLFITSDFMDNGFKLV